MPSIIITADNMDDLERVKAFVDTLPEVHISTPTKAEKEQALAGLLSLKGIWAEEDITVDTLRESAWLRS
ncbi:MAG TPA: hypothetical protein DCE41_08020 [Cytophagales bacterium]|nr:hypothetical protein [Cytophagales bacterium]HAA24142.1 hypothetical protein [Cytophagales bacterium]